MRNALAKGGLTMTDDRILDWTTWYKLKQISDDISNYTFKRENKYHIENIVRKEKLLVTSDFSLSYNVILSYISLVRQNTVLSGNELIDLHDALYQARHHTIGHPPPPIFFPLNSLPNDKF